MQFSLLRFKNICLSSLRAFLLLYLFSSLVVNFIHSHDSIATAGTEERKPVPDKTGDDCVICAFTIMDPPQNNIVSTVPGYGNENLFTPGPLILKAEFVPLLIVRGPPLNTAHPCI